MLSILDRYFLRELGRTVAATLAVLLVIVTGSTLAEVFQQVANGSFPASVMLPVLGLKLIDGLPDVLPLASFVGVLLGLGRMYRESEMHVLASSGMAPSGPLRPLLLLGTVLVTVTAILSSWLGPWAARTSDLMVATANRSVIAAGLDAGRWTDLPGKEGIIFVDSLSGDGTQMGRTFLATQRSSKDGNTHLRVVTAASGHLYPGSDGDSRFIAFRDGWQYDIPLGADNWKQLRYQRNDTSLSSVKRYGDDSSPLQGLSNGALTRLGDSAARAELAWRLSAPPMTLMLLLLALPLARQSPREPRYGRLLLAGLCFYLYFMLLLLARAQISKGHWHDGASLWLLHALVLAVASWMLWRQHAPRRVAPANHVPYATGMADSRAPKDRPEPALNSAVAARVTLGPDGTGQPEAIAAVSGPSNSQRRRLQEVRTPRWRLRLFTLKRVDYLIALSVIGAVLTTWLVLTGFQAVTQLLRQLVRIGKNGFSLNDAFIYVLLTLPRRAYEMFGNSALVGGLMALGGLAATGELTALRALGMSRLRIAASVAGVVALLLSGVVIIGETAAPWGDQQAQAMDLRMSAGSLGITSSGLWARDGNTIINARRPLLRVREGVSSVELGDVRLFTLTPVGQLSRFEWARRAEYDHAQWILQDVRSTTLDSQGLHTTLMSRQRWHSNLDPKVLALSAIKPEHLSIRDLQRNISYLRSNGESPGSYEVALWARVFYPLNVLVLVLCAMPFAFGTLRSGGLGKRIFIGMLLAVGWYFMQRVIVNFAIVYGIAPVLANLLPAAFVSFLARWYFRRAT